MVFKGYFSKETIQHLTLHNGQNRRHYQRSQDIKLACKLTLTYGKYHLMMLHRQLAMSEERTSFQQAERTADMMNKMTVFHSSPTDFLHTQEQSADESKDVYKEYKQLVAEYTSWISSARRSMKTRNISSSSNLFATCTSLYMLMLCFGTSKARLITTSFACSSKN